MKSDGSGPIIGQAISSYNGGGVGVVMTFVKNFDLSTYSLLLGDISQTEGLETLIATIQSEASRDA